VRILGTERGSSWGYSLWEVKVYEAFNPRPRLASFPLFSAVRLTHSGL
jgi:hypothetical protein